MPKFTVVEIVERQEFVIHLDDQGQPIEPRCPSCGTGVLRPKCMFELGGDCPRHDLITAYRVAKEQVTAGG